GDLADAEVFAALDEARGVGRDAVAGNEGAFGGAEIFDEEAAAIDGKAGVAAGDGAIVDDDAVAVGAADEEVGEVERVVTDGAVGGRDPEDTELQGTASTSTGTPGRALRIRRLGGEEDIGGIAGAPVKG